MNPCFFPLVRSVSGALLLFSPAEATTAKGKATGIEVARVEINSRCTGSARAATFHIILTGAASGGVSRRWGYSVWLKCRPLYCITAFPRRGYRLSSAGLAFFGVFSIRRMRRHPVPDHFFGNTSVEGSKAKLRRYQKGVIISSPHLQIAI